MPATTRPTRPPSQVTLAVAALLIAIIAATSAFAPSQAEAATIKAYKDGPVLFLTKSETRYVGKTSVAVAAAWFGVQTGGWGIPAAAAVTVINDVYVDQQVNRGYCIQVKMQFWNPRWIRSSWYSYAPWCR